MKLRTILQKSESDRRVKDLQTLLEFFKFTSFFILMKIKEKELREIVRHLHYRECLKNNYLVRYGSDADDFYILLNG